MTTPLAGRPGPLCAALAGDREGAERPGEGYSTSTNMHSARLDSFLSQLRWELVRLWSGCGCKDVCGVRDCRLAGTTNGFGVGSGCPSESRWGQGRAVQMAQMARFGFLTVGSCSGHQVTGAQLALLGGGGGYSGERFLLGTGREHQGPKEVLCCRGHPLPRAGLYLLPLPCLPALVARADLPSPACCSLQDCHQLCGWEPYEPRLPVPPYGPYAYSSALLPRGFSSLCELSVHGWPGQTLSDDKKSLSDFCSLFPFSCVVGTQAHLQCLAHCNQNPKPIQVYSPTAS